MLEGREQRRRDHVVMLNFPKLELGKLIGTIHKESRKVDGKEGSYKKENRCSCFLCCGFRFVWLRGSVEN